MFNRWFLGITSFSLILFCVLSLSCSAQARGYQTLQIKGSDTMVNLGQAWSEEFMRIYPDISIAVTGGGSGTGIAAIISGTCDIAQSSRSMTEEEIHKAEVTGEAVTETIVGYDGIAVVVHPSNPVSKLTMGQVAGIFTGEIKNWNEVGGEDLPILILSRDRNSGTHVFFLVHVLRKGNSKGPEEFAKEALMMPSNQSLVQEIKTSETGIGYVGLGYVSKDLKVLGIVGTEEGTDILPSLQSVKSGEYPISRPFYFYTTGEPKGYVKKFIDYVLGSDGQAIIEILDFVPLKEK